MLRVRYHFSEWWPAYAGLALGIGLFAAAFGALTADQKQWDAFAATHACKVVGRMSGDVLVSPVFSDKGGVAVTSTPDKTGWLCNDGVTYWR